MELPSAALAGHRVEAVTDVESQHTEHRHEHPYTCTGRTVEFERVIRFYPGIRITAFCEHEGVNARRLSQSYRITQFHREFVVYRVSFASVRLHWKLWCCPCNLGAILSRCRNNGTATYRCLPSGSARKAQARHCDCTFQDSQIPRWSQALILPQCYYHHVALCQFLVCNIPTIRNVRRRTFSPLEPCNLFR